MRKLVLIFLLALSSQAHAHDQSVVDAINEMFINPTHTSVQGSGLLWSKPDSWVGGQVPGDGSTVLVPVGSGLDFDGDTARLSWIRVQGHLGIAPPLVPCTCPDAPPVPPNPVPPMTIQVETLVVDMGGELFVGDDTNRITAPITFVFTNTGPINTTWDTRMLSRGLVSMGAVKLYGAEVTPFGYTNGALKGSTTVTLESPVQGWRPGDKVVLPGLSRLTRNDDEIAIAAVSADGLQVTLVSPLVYDHPSAPSRPMPVANLTRRITLKSESTSTPPVRGHTMFMHPPEVSYVAFQGLGRQDKLKLVTDFPNITNVRGRYAFHVHMMGIRKGIDPVLTVKGAVVEDCPNWGFVNHSSQVHFEDSITYKVVGAGFVGETGDELGSFRRSLAIRSPGDGKSVPGQADDRLNSDFAFGGHGFWAQGGGILMEDNIATGAQSSAFVFMGQAFKLPGTTLYTTFPVANMPDPTWVPPGYGSKLYVSPAQVPSSFRRNVSFGSYVGLVVWAMGGNAMPRTYVPTPGVFEDSYLEADGNAVLFGYPSWQTIRGLTLRPSNNKWDQTAVGHTGVCTGCVSENLDIRGYSTGILGPTNYESKISGNTIQALTGIYMLNTYQATGRTVTMENNTFLDVPPEVITMASAPTLPYSGMPFQKFQGKKQKDVTAVWDMATASIYVPSNPFWYWTSAFTSPNRSDQPKDKMLVDGKRLYLVEEGPAFVTTPVTSFPLEVKKRADGTTRTTADLVTDLGLYLGNAVLPGDLTTDLRIIGPLSSADRTFVPNLTVNKNLSFYQVTGTCAGFTLKVKNAASVFQEFGPYELTAGVWNFPIIENIDGYRRGVPVFCDPTGVKPPSSW